MRRSTILALATALLATPIAAEVPVSLKGSPASMIRQNEAAKALEYPFIRTVEELRELERAGEMVRIEGNDDYEVAEFVSHTLARPAMKLFIERLAAQYRAATGERLVVTSLTRPAGNQPRNSHALSVHPTGIAVDLRVSQSAESRRWLEEALLGLERSGTLDVTREYSPPHYHVALFPEAYLTYVAARIDAEPLETDPAAEASLEPLNAAVGASTLTGAGAEARAAPADRSPWAAASGAAAAILLLLGIRPWKPVIRLPRSGR